MRVLLRKKNTETESNIFFYVLASRNSKKQGGREVIYWSVAVVQIEQTLFIIHILFW